MRYKTIICMVLTILLLCFSKVMATNYAVLISAGEATEDDAMYNSAFWYDLYLQYITLLNGGYDSGNIYVLYGAGEDFKSEKVLYQPRSKVTDYAVNRESINMVFTELSTVMSNDDNIYIWWMGHGMRLGQDGLRMYISTSVTMETVSDSELEEWIGKINNYDVRIFSWMTCSSGAILDNFAGVKSIVMSSSKSDEDSYDRWLWDSWHAEFHYFEREAWMSSQDFFGKQVGDGVDCNDDGMVSASECFTYTELNVMRSSPQISDDGWMAPFTYLDGYLRWRMIPEENIIEGGENMKIRNGNIVLSFPAPSQHPGNLEYHDGYLWIVDDMEDVIYKIDPVNGDVLDCLILLESELDIFIQNGQSGSLQSEIGVYDGIPTNLGGMTWDGGHLWYGIMSGWSSRMVEVDVDNGLTGRVIFTKGHPRALTTDGKSIWNATDNGGRRLGIIYEYRLSDGVCISQFDTPGFYPTGLAWDGEYLWCVDRETKMVYKLENGIY